MKTTIFLLILAISTTSAGDNVIFSDDFESGSLDQWIIGGRQRDEHGGINIAEVIYRNSSQMAHIHHSLDTTEITLEKLLEYCPNLIFNFDMEVSVSSIAGPTDADYAMGGAFFDFLDSSGELIGFVRYICSTSSYPFTTENPSPSREYIALPDSSLHSYSFTLEDILSHITVDTDSIAYINFSFWAYNSGWGWNMSADVWVDNVVVSVPELVGLDIKPQSCPNPLNLESRGVLPVAVLGSEDFDVNNIDVASIRLADVAPIRSSFEDVATPVADGNECECTAEGPDGYTDLTLKFKTREIVEKLINAPNELVGGQTLSLTLTGALSNDTLIEGTDCVLLVGNVPKWLAARRWDANGDGLINMADFTVFAENWLQTSIP